MTGRARQLDALLVLAIVVLIAASLGVAALRGRVVDERDHSPDEHHGAAATDHDRAPSQVLHGAAQDRPEPHREGR